MRDLPRPGLKPMSAALAGRFLTTVPPGKSYLHFKPTLDIGKLLKFVSFIGKMETYFKIIHWYLFIHQFLYPLLILPLGCLSFLLILNIFILIVKEISPLLSYSEYFFCFDFVYGAFLQQEVLNFCTVRFICLLFCFHIFASCLKSFPHSRLFKNHYIFTL